MHAKQKIMTPEKHLHLRYCQIFFESIEQGLRFDDEASKK